MIDDIETTGENPDITPTSIEPTETIEHPIDTEPATCRILFETEDLLWVCECREPICKWCYFTWAASRSCCEICKVEYRVEFCQFCERLANDIKASGDVISSQHTCSACQKIVDQRNTENENSAPRFGHTQVWQYFGIEHHDSHDERTARERLFQMVLYLMGLISLAVWVILYSILLVIHESHLVLSIYALVGGSTTLLVPIHPLGTIVAHLAYLGGLGYCALFADMDITTIVSVTMVPLVFAFATCAVPRKKLCFF